MQYCLVAFFHSRNSFKIRLSLLKSCLINYIYVIFCLLSFQQSSQHLHQDRILFEKFCPLFAHPKGAAPHPLKFIMRCSSVVTSSCLTSNASSLAISTTSAVSFLHEVSNPSKSNAMRVEISFFQTPLNIAVLTPPMNHECSQWHQEQWILPSSCSVYFA